MHSFTSCLIHCVWTTKNRERALNHDLRQRLWRYLGGIAKQNKIKAVAIGGTSDHVHVLFYLPWTLSIAKAVQVLKGNSSKWMQETFPRLRDVEWQEGYGAFSIGISSIDATKRYIHSQEKHHRHRSFHEELAAILRKHHFVCYESMLD
jgi:putative transposase